MERQRRLSSPQLFIPAVLLLSLASIWVSFHHTSSPVRAASIEVPMSCPSKSWRNLVFLHIPKAAGAGSPLPGGAPPASASMTGALLSLSLSGTTVRLGVLEEGFKQHKSGAGTPIRPCNSLRPRHQRERFPYSCLLHSSGQRQEALTYVENHLGRSCEALVSHWDASVLASIDPLVRQQTMLITSLRHPVDRFIR